mmetsp:Transcript_17297/g.50440  ORF Transcript_17297/g.50440 Transcript_17297/m.50440 type:complete len:341 (-) Transcript_17297:513-1535(-)
MAVQVGEMDGPVRVAVVGAGAFGTALATVAARNQHSVFLFCRDEEQAEAINTTRRNPKYLSEFDLPETIQATTSLAEALAGAQLVILAIPAQKLPEFLADHKAIVPTEAILCCSSKGLYLPTKQLLSDAMRDALGREQPMAFLSGPSFAEEMMRAFPTAVVVASRLLYHAVSIQRWLSSLTFRIYTTQDVVGVQLGGALKNPLAVGAGMIEGMGMGINTMAAYVTRSSQELQTLCVAMGGQADTISGLAGVGDLMLTAFGSLSRNRRCGMRLVKGEKLDDILRSMTVEGVPTAEVAVHYAHMCGLELPLFSTVYAILEGTVDPKDAQQILMGRPLGAEKS